MSDTQTDRVTVTCECGARLGLRTSFAGHKAKCPKCGRSFIVPSPDQATPPAKPAYPSPQPPAPTTQSTAVPMGTMSTTCACGKRMRVPASSVGRKARCPACGGVFIISQLSVAEPVRPAPPPRKAAAPPPSEPAPEPTAQDEEQDDGTYGWSEESGSLLSEAESQPALSAPLTHKLCPQCGVTMSTDARLCVACGFDTRTGRRAQDTAVATGGGLSAVGGMLGSAVKSGGAILLGTLLSFLGAMLGAAIWAGIAYATNLEIGYVAWAIGGLAGGGMYLGFRNQSTIAGLIASFMALLGIVVGKIGYVVLVLLPLVTALAGAANNANSDDPGNGAGAGSDTALVYQLSHHHAELKGNHQGLSRDDLKREAIFRQEEERFRKMSPEQLKKAGEDLKKWNEGGKWKDSAYVRDFLIYSYIDEALQAEADRQEVDPDELEIAPAQWQQYYKAAAKRADAVPAGERVAEAKRIEAEHEKALAELDDDPGEGSAGAVATGFLALFFRSMFGLMDVIFIILAVATAYHLASGLSFGG